MVAELEGASSEGQIAEPSPVSAPERSQIEEFEYLLGEKASRLPANAEFSLKNDGRIDKIPLSKIINGYRELTSLKPKYQQLTGVEKKWAEERGQYDKSLKELEPFKKLQEWSLKRPDAFEFVMKHMKLDENGLLTLSEDARAPGVNEGLNSVISDLKNQVSQLSEWKSGWEKQQEEARLQNEDREVSKETEELVDYLKQKGIEIDLDEKDESGISLRGRIYKYGADNHIASVKAAALSYLSDTLLDKAMQRGRSEAVKGVRGDARAGIISRSSTPTNGQSKPIDVRRMTPEQRMRAALAEYTEAGE